MRPAVPCWRRAQAAEELRLAQAHMAAATAALAQAKAKATGGLTTAHGQAATAHAAAVTRAQAAQTAMTTAGGLLLRVLGGPVGIIALLASAAAAAVSFGGDSQSASNKVDGLVTSVDALTGALKNLNRAGLSSAAQTVQGRIDDAARLAVDAQDKLSDLQKQLSAAPEGSRETAWTMLPWRASSAP